ncbi:MAG: HAD-IIIA family hydrolase [Candidatus Cloacimonadota bacterium]|nr:HAD-IIIA family hydrolase [Candidatus Cloacimonadota bacterium]
MQNTNKIKLLILDCDGVLTDGKIIYDNNLIESKAFSAKDGLGIKLIQFSRIEVAIITGRKSEVVSQRARDLKIKYVYQNIKNKLKFAESLLQELHLSWENVAYMGDDWNDYPVIQKVGLSGCPADVSPLFSKKVDFQSTKNGGDGAVREFIEYILKNSIGLETTIDKFVEFLKNKKR